MAEKGETLLVEDDDEQQEEELVVTEEPPEDEEGDSQEDERVQQTSDSKEDDERAEIRERRRREKLERKERRDKAVARDKLELDFLRKRNDDLERRISAQEQRSHQSDLHGYDKAIHDAHNEIQMAERVIAKAIEAGNGEDVTQAMRYRDQALFRAQQLAHEKQQAAQQAAPKNNGIDDVTLSHAKLFMEENPWYDVQGGDEDSAIVMAIDQAISKEGFNPKTEEYWDELRKRTAKRLPEKFKQTQRVPRGGPAVGSGREHAPASTRKEIYISPERKQALIEAGVWDDPVLRMRYVKRYAEYDRQARN